MKSLMAQVFNFLVLVVKFYFYKGKYTLGYTCSQFYNFLKEFLHFLRLHVLKVVSATFMLVCFVSLKEGTCETRKNVFYFTSKAHFILEIIKFQLFRYWNVMTSSDAQAWNTKHILLDNLRSKHSLVMKFG